MRIPLVLYQGSYVLDIESSIRYAKEKETRT
jgi:hypothetical protein